MTTDRLTRVTVDGLELNEVDTNGTAWEFLTIDGWHTGPGVTTTQTQRVTGHGQFAQDSHRTGRVIAITAQIRAHARTHIADAIDTLAALLADGGFGRFEFFDVDHGHRWADVQLLTEPDFAWNGSPYLRYQLQLLAPGSYRYGVTSTETTGFATDPTGVGAVFPAFGAGVFEFGDVDTGNVGVVTARNPGNAPATPLFTVTGPAPAGGFTITETTTGRTITYLGTLPDGSTLVIDPSDASALIDGVADRSGDVVVTGGWPTVPANSERDYLFQSNGEATAAELTLTCTATYW
jgi:hypothetical protein